MKIERMELLKFEGKKIDRVFAVLGDDNTEWVSFIDIPFCKKPGYGNTTRTLKFFRELPIDEKMIKFLETINLRNFFGAEQFFEFGELRFLMDEEPCPFISLEDIQTENLNRREGFNLAQEMFE